MANIIVCDSCNKEFTIEDIKLKQENFNVEIIKKTRIYFVCPYCKSRYIVLEKICKD